MSELQLMIEPTNEAVVLPGGMVARRWNGVTAGGVPCIVWVPLVQVPTEADQAAFARELCELPPIEHYVDARAAASGPVLEPGRN